MNQKFSKDDLDQNTAEPADEAEQKVGQPGDKPYSGVLAQPIVLDWTKGNLADKILDYNNKVDALFDHFQVEHGNFLGLANPNYG